MNAQANNQNNNQGTSRRAKRRRQKKVKPVDLWRPVPQLPDPVPIDASTDPGMVIRSLGAPPLHGQGSQAEHAFELVARRAAVLATALAATAGLLSDPNAEDDPSDGSI